MKEILFHVWKKIFSHKIWNLLMMILLVYSLHLCSLTFFCKVITDHGMRLLDRCFYGSPESTLLIKIPDSFSFEEETELEEEIVRIPGIHGIGNYSISGYRKMSFDPGKNSDELDQIFRIAETKGSITGGDFFEGTEKGKQVVEDPLLNLVNCGPGSFRLFDSELVNGKAPGNDEHPDTHTVLLYLGWDYRSVPIGTEFQASNSDTVIRVAGILKKGTSVFDRDAIFQPGASDSYQYSLDQSGFLVFDEDIERTGYTMCTLEEGIDVQQVISGLKEIYKAHGQKLHFTTLSERAEGIFHSFYTVHDTLKGTFWITTVLVMLGILILSFLSMMRSSSDLGIFIANGYSRKQLVMISFVENFIRVLVAFVFAYILSYRKVCDLWLVDNPIVQKEYLNVLNGTTMIATVVLAFILLSVSSVIPIYFCFCKSESELVKGDWR